MPNRAEINMLVIIVNISVCDTEKFSKNEFLKTSAKLKVFYLQMKIFCINSILKMLFD